MWFRTRALLGPTPRTSQILLLKLLDVSRQGNRIKSARLLLFYFGVSALMVAITAREWLGLAIVIAPIVLIGWLNARTMTAPVMLIMGESTHSAVRRHRAVKRKLSPLRVVSLLDTNIPWDTGLAREMALDCYRTRNEGDWWQVITQLMEIAPVLAIDAAAETKGVYRETCHILKTGLWQKCLFLTPPDGRAPVLDNLLPNTRVRRQELRIVRYEEMDRVSATMIAQIGLSNVRP